MDLLFAVEARTDPKELRLQLNYVLNITNTIDVARSRVGLIVYKGKAVVKIPLTNFINRVSLKKEISSVQYSGDSSKHVYFAELYTVAFQTFYHSQDSNGKKHLFVVTYGGKIIRDIQVLQAMKMVLSQQGADVVAVVVSNTTGRELKELVLNESNLFIGNTPDDLSVHTPRIAEFLCKGMLSKFKQLCI